MADRVANELRKAGCAAARALLRVLERGAEHLHRPVEVLLRLPASSLGGARPERETRADSPTAIATGSGVPFHRLDEARRLAAHGSRTVSTLECRISLGASRRSSSVNVWSILFARPIDVVLNVTGCRFSRGRRRPSRTSSGKMFLYELAVATQRAQAALGRDGA
jgi:hypothetical protein